ncbi:non-ribosomal peptide synthetase [Actinoplanes sp. L3-i22]|uniref:non-ribosomal peptide synthetase n=1 Tax=Actinoplanes sp. L3-i22 TaxID=2836373 RepID=UPI001C781C5D|nr:non-ribosomal peptide synthetase [Actinoplanes sp. L3-i22]BCY09071.1 hypothetical protein L3i22_041590 [Actinoplanes sp. L3-i22]
MTEPIATVVAEFFARAAAEPQRTALADDAGPLTYGALAGWARRLAPLLPAAAESLVGIELPRGRDLLAAVLGVLHAGAVPVLCDPALRRHLHRIGAPVLRLGPQPVRAAATGPEVTGSPPRRLPPGALAYVCHTSGSTGEPRWVGVPHGALRARLDWSRRAYPLTPDDRVLWQAEPGFDFAFWEMLAPLRDGACVVVAGDLGQRDPRETARRLRHDRVTVAHFVPSALRAHLRQEGAASLAGLRLLLVGGEQFDTDLLERLREAPGPRVLNQYGPAETCIDSTWFDATDAGPAAVVPIGWPIDGTVLRPLGPVDPGTGTVALGVGGAGLARGYLGDPRATADRFVPDPDGPPGARLYRTGDLVRSAARDGWEFAGRTDEQVKVNGVRVEPAAVLAAVRAAWPQATAAVAPVAGPDGPRLVAFVAGADTTGAARRLEEHLPAAMIPVVVTVPAIPRLASGKPDLRALTERYLAERAPAPHAEPADLTATESRLIKIWVELLQVTAVTPGDSFFELGGHSLMATELAAEIEDEFGIELPLREVFDRDSLRELAEYLDQLPGSAAGR